VAKASAPSEERKQPETFLLELGHAQVAFREVVVEGHTHVRDKPQDRLAVGAQARARIVGRRLFDPASTARWRKALRMKEDSVGENAVVTGGDRLRRGR
jgi:hypothetical protein